MTKPVSLLNIYTRMRAACIDAGGQSAWARLIGVSPTYLSDVLNGRSDPGTSILKALNLKKITQYVSIGDKE